jgi:acyl carrier protein
MAPESDVAARTRAALAARLKRNVDAIQLQDDLRNDLGLDSLDMIELLFKIEEVFDLEIPNEDLVQIATVGDVIAYVERRLAAKAAAPERPPAPAPKPAPASIPSPAPAASTAPAPKRASRRPPARVRKNRM